MAQTLYVFNASKQSFVNLGVRVADTPFARLRGLLGQMTLRRDEGLWMIPSHGIHTIGLMFPVDVIYLDSHLRVVHLIQDLRRFRIAINLESASVLELPTESISNSGTQVGDQLLIRSPEEMDEYWASQRHAQSVQAAKNSS